MTRPVFEIAREIKQVWQKPNFAAVPYLNAMHSINGIEDKYYFDTGLDDFRYRIIAIAADIEKSDLDVSRKQYRDLIDNADSIIHSAALVKHYGDYATFYQANVQATINLLELAKQTS